MLRWSACCDLRRRPFCWHAVSKQARNKVQEENIEYLPGRKHVNGDALSRQPTHLCKWEDCEDCASLDLVVVAHGAATEESLQMTDEPYRGIQFQSDELSESLEVDPTSYESKTVLFRNSGSVPSKVVVWCLTVQQTCLPMLLRFVRKDQTTWRVDSWTQR